MLIIIDSRSLYCHIFVYPIPNGVAPMPAVNICLNWSLLNPYYIILINLYTM